MSRICRAAMMVHTLDDGVDNINAEGFRHPVAEIPDPDASINIPKSCSY